MKRSRHFQFWGEWRQLLDKEQIEEARYHEKHETRRATPQQKTSS
jgi:hypothetical protein